MSVVNFEHKHVFIRIPRTAGASIESLSWVGYPGMTATTPFNTIEQELADNEVNGDAFFKWTIVRHPLDRLRSIYRHLGQVKPYGDIEHLAFKEFVQALTPAMIAERQFLRPQVSFITTGSKLAVDFVGRYEQLFDDFHFVCYFLGIADRSLPRLNETAMPLAPDCYDIPTLLKAVELYRADFEAFNYDVIWRPNKASVLKNKYPQIWRFVTDDAHMPAQFSSI